MFKFEMITNEQEQLRSEYRKAGVELTSEVKEMSQPLGHGTTSEYIDDILKDGLGAVLPEKAYSRTKSVFDLKHEEGILGAYLFSRFNIEDLKLESNTDAYTCVAKMMKIDVDHLKRQFESYKDIKNPTGYPVVLVYDGDDEIDTNLPVPEIASELEFADTVKNNKLKFILVPDVHRSETEEKIAFYNMDCTILSVEILEVMIDDNY